MLNHITQNTTLLAVQTKHQVVQFNKILERIWWAIPPFLQLCTNALQVGSILWNQEPATKAAAQTLPSYSKYSQHNFKQWLNDRSDARYVNLKRKIRQPDNSLPDRMLCISTHFCLECTRMMILSQYQRLLPRLHQEYTLGHVFGMKRHKQPLLKH